MMDRDDLYSYQMEIRNLLLAKFAYDYGLDMSKLDDYRVYLNSQQVNSDMDIFMSAVTQMVHEWELLFPYSEEINDKEYWLRLVDFEYFGSIDSYGIMVFLHDDILPFNSFSLDGGMDDSWYMTFGEIYSIERGIVVVYDEEDGALDLTELFGEIIGIFEYSEEKRRRENHAMAV